MIDTPSRRLSPTLPSPRRRVSRRLVVAAAVGTALLLFALTSMFFSWLVVIGVWFAIALSCMHSTDRFPTPPHFVRVQTFAAFAFPLVATAWKWHEIQQQAVERNFLANRIQHFGWAMCLVLLFAPALWRHRNAVSNAARMFWALGLVGVAGNFGEIFEYRNSRFAAFETPFRGGWLYRDTMIDLAMNLAGGLLAFAITMTLERRTRTAESPVVAPEPGSRFEPFARFLEAPARPTARARS